MIASLEGAIAPLYRPALHVSVHHFVVAMESVDDAIIQLQHAAETPWVSDQADLFRASIFQRIRELRALRARIEEAHSATSTFCRVARDAGHLVTA